MGICLFNGAGQRAQGKGLRAQSAGKEKIIVREKMDSPPERDYPDRGAGESGVGLVKQDLKF